MHGVVSEALASGKVDWGDPYTKGSQTATSGTDEQKRYMRLYNTDKQTHLCNVQRTPKGLYSRYRSDWTKGIALTRGGLGIDSVSMSQEVSRGRSSWQKRAIIDRWMVSQNQQRAERYIATNIAWRFIGNSMPATNRGSRKTTEEKGCKSRKCKEKKMNW
jgi:hypothetical protein